MENKVITYACSILFMGFVCACSSPAGTEKSIGAVALEESLKPIRPGEPGSQPFWNQYAQRFIYAPAFDMPEVTGAVDYRFTIKSSGEESLTFTAENPWAALSPVWNAMPEGYATLTVEGLDSAGKVVGKSGERSFYRSPAFSGNVAQPVILYEDAAYTAFKAIYEATYVQNWIADSVPDRSYDLYSYPTKVIGGLMRAMAAYSKITKTAEERELALKIGRRSADYLLSIALPATSHFAQIPPTYALNVDKPLHGARRGFDNHWFMTTSSTDAAFGFLDLYDVTKDTKYYDAALRIADMLLKKQEADGTWPHVVNEKTGEPVAEQRLIPTWVIFLFDRLEQQYGETVYRQARSLAWDWIVRNPLKTYQWDGQFEDAKPRKPYVNMAREQACDIAIILLSDNKRNSEAVAQALELLRYAEDQFVVWTPVQDCEGWRKAITHPRKHCEKWITPMVLEQYVCYDPVARSSAILINAYLRAYDVTGKRLFRAKAKALANGLLKGQEWFADAKNGNGLIPTWLMKTNGKNWINNSFYAAEAVLNFSDITAADKAATMPPL